MKGAHFYLAFVSLTLVAAQAHATELVIDGNFETPNSLAWIYPFNNMIENWNVPGMTGYSLSLGFGGTGGDYAMQVMDMSHYKNAVLSFDLTTIAHGWVGSGEFAVTLGYDNTLAEAFVGSTTDGLITTQHFDIALTDPKEYTPFTPLIFGSIQASDTHDEMYVDNVSIKAQAVPEPTTMTVFGLGGLALIRRRHRR